MTSETFISAVKTAVHDSGVRGVTETLKRPGGRRPPQRLVELSRWFQSLAPADQERVQQVIQLAVHSGIFGVLTVLDGVVQIESGSDKGTLELFYEHNGERQLLTDPSGEFLHDIYQGHVYEQVFGSIG